MSIVFTGDSQRDRYKKRVVESQSHPQRRRVWDMQGVSIRTVVRRTWEASIADRLFGHAAELGFYFLFALFPTLFCASSMLGLVARSAFSIYDRLLDYLALVIPTTALGTVLKAFNETTAAASSSKVTFGLIAAIWSASIGVSAVQDTLDVVCKAQNTRSYVKARIYAIGLTILLTIIVTSGLAALLGGDFVAAMAYRYFGYGVLAAAGAETVRLLGRVTAAALLCLSFAVVYYWAPDSPNRRWHWLTPGSGIAILGWMLASFGFRIYIHYFNNFSVTYGSLGAVIILLTWFYITGLMLLIGAEIDTEIERAAAEMRGAG